MPSYRYKCECGVQTKRIRTVKDATEKPTPPCGTCGRPMVRDAQGPSTRITETLDNGIMSRRVERVADVERLQDERAHLPEDRERIP